MENEVVTVFEWLIAGGALTVVTVGLSWLLEGAQWWHKLASMLKSLIILALSILLGLGARWVLSMPDLLSNPYFITGVGIIVAWVGTQFGHKIDPDRRPSEPPIP